MAMRPAKEWADEIYEFLRQITGMKIGGGWLPKIVRTIQANAIHNTAELFDGPVPENGKDPVIGRAHAIARIRRFAAEVEKKL